MPETSYSKGTSVLTKNTRIKQPFEILLWRAFFPGLSRIEPNVPVQTMLRDAASFRRLNSLIALIFALAFKLFTICINL